MKEKCFIVTLLVLTIITVLRLYLATSLDLTPDEAYYWVCSQNLALSYYDHPPMIIYLIKLSTTIFGTTELAVRLPSILISLIVTILTYLTIYELTSNPILGYFGIIILNLIPVFTLGPVLATPDIPLILFWSLGIFFLIKLIKTNNINYWYYLALATGLGFLSKYMMILFVISMFMVLIIFKEQRKVFTLKNLIIYAIISGIIFAPVIIWNMTHNWASFGFQLKHGLEMKEYQPLYNLGLYFVSQLGIISPLLWIITIFLGIRYFINGIVKKNVIYTILSLPLLLVITFFAITSLRSRVEPNWPVTAYYTGSLLLTLWLNEQWDSIKIRTLKLFIIIPSILVSVVMISIIFYPKAIQKYGINSIISDVYGWEKHCLNIKEIVDKEKGGPDLIITTPQYQLAAELKFYFRKNKSLLEQKVVCLNLGSRVTAFDYFKKQLVVEKGSNARALETPLDKIAPYFQKWTELNPVRYFFYNEVVRVTHILKLENYKGGLY